MLHCKYSAKIAGTCDSWVRDSVDIQWKSTHAVKAYGGSGGFALGEGERSASHRRPLDPRRMILSTEFPCLLLASYCFIYRILYVLDDGYSFTAETCSPVLDECMLC